MKFNLKMILKMAGATINKLNFIYSFIQKIMGRKYKRKNKR